MSSINKVILIGNVGSDPVVKHSEGGLPFCHISLATTDRAKDNKNGGYKESPEWHKVVLFGKLAEIAGEYVEKGSKIYIEGSIRTNNWEDKDGNKRTSIDIIAKDLQVMVYKNKGDEDYHYGSGQIVLNKPEKINITTKDDIEDDDIPF